MNMIFVLLALAVIVIALKIHHLADWTVDEP
jgi:hypothetical protein